MPTTLNQATKAKVIYTVEKLQDIFVGAGETVRSIFNHNHQVPTQNIDHKKACIKFIICILDTIHDFNSSSSVMKEWVEWMLIYGGELEGNPIKGNPNKLWKDSNSSNLPGLNKDEIIQTMVSYPEDVALYFIFGWENSKTVSDIGHEYRFEYYTDKSLTNYEGYKAFYMAHQDKYNNDWICNELVKKQKIFVKQTGSNTGYKYYNGTTPKFIDKNNIEQTQGPSFMVDHGCPNYILNAFTLDQYNQGVLASQLTPTVGPAPDPIFGTIPSNMNFNCAEYSGIAKNYDMGWIRNISEGCDDIEIRHNHIDADATIASLFFEITDSDKSMIQYIDPDSTNPTTAGVAAPKTTITLLNNAAGKQGLRNTLKYLISQYNSSAASGVANFFTLANGSAKKAFEITFNAFKKALLPNLWKPSADKTELWKKLSINYDLKRNGDWNQSIDCLRKDSDCSGSGWDETVFITHDGIAAAISSVIVGANTIWVWAIAGNRTETSSVYIPRCNTSIPLPLSPNNIADISLPISYFIDRIDQSYANPLMTGGGPKEIMYVRSNPVTKQKLKECLYELCSISSFNYNIIQPLQTYIHDIDMKELLCNTYIYKYNWDIITNPTNNEKFINFYDENFDKYENSLIKMVKDKRSIGSYLTKQKNSMPKNIKRGNTTIAQEREGLEKRSNAIITDTQNRRNTQMNSRRGITNVRRKADIATPHSGGQNSKTVGNLIKEALINFCDKYKSIEDTDKDEYINNIYTTLLYKLLNYKLNGIKVGSDEYMCHIMGIVLEENILSLIKLNLPNISWSKIEEIIEVNEDNELVNEIKNINKEKKTLFKRRLNRELTYTFNKIKSIDKTNSLNIEKYLKDSFDEILNEFKDSISYIIDIILSTKNYEVSDEKAIQVLKIIDTILQNTESKKTPKKVKSAIANMKPFQDNEVKEYFPSQLKKKRVNGIVTTANKQVPSLRNSKIRILSKVPLKFNIKATNQDKLKTPKKPSQMLTNQDKLKTPKKPSQMLTNQDKLKTPKKPSQMLTRQDKSIRDKLKLRIEQFKNKDFSPYFEKKINSHINDMDVNIYNIGINRMKSILKDIYEIKK